MSEMEKRVDAARKYLTLVRAKCGDNSSKYDEFLNIMKAFKEQRMDTETVCRKVQDLFRGHRKLLTEFNKLIPTHYRVQVEPRPQYNEAIEYMRRVREETKEDATIYERFMNILKLYQNKNLSLDQVNTAVRELLQGYPELMESFKAFLPETYEESQEEEEIQIRPLSISVQPYPVETLVVDEIRDPINKNEVMFFKDLERVLELNSQENTDYYLEVIQCLELYTECVVTKKELSEMVQDLFKATEPLNFLASSAQGRRLHKDNSRELQSFVQTKLDEYFKNFMTIVTSRESNRRKLGWFFRPLSEFDTKQVKRHGHSYLEIQRPRIKKLKEPELVNSQWVSVPYGSEDFSFKNFRKNMFEDALFKCEDERYETDMNIETTAYTLELLMEAKNKAFELPLDQQKNFQLDESIINNFRLKPIKSIYAEHWERFAEKLKSNPVKALPVIISRVEQKLESMRRISKPASERVWDETIEKNFTKSLDHRSFYFKQNEKKMTNSKNFIQEAKQRFSNRHQNKQRLKAHLLSRPIPDDFEFLGGSKRRYFFNSFSGLSVAICHKVPLDFQDKMLEQFSELSGQEPSHCFLAEHCSTPHFRLLLNCIPVLHDSLRVLVYAIEKSNISEKEKLNKWVVSFFQDFMKIQLPSDIIHHKVEVFFENIPETEIPENPQQEQDVERTRRIITRWIDNEGNSEPEPDDNLSIPELAQDPIVLRKDQSFSAFLPLLENNQVMYCSNALYCFIRFFYAIYERLLKVKMILNGSEKEEEKGPLDYGDYLFSNEVETEYLGFLKTVCMVLKSTYDNTKFEDKCRSLLGNEAYVLFTFDKLVNYSVKSLQSLANEDFSSKCFSLYNKFSRHRLNEEMYFSEFLSLPINSNQLFRLHSDSKNNVLSVTYIESPSERMQESVIRSAQKYSKKLLSFSTRVPLSSEIEILQKRLDDFYSTYNVTPSSFSEQVFVSNQIPMGLTENTYKLNFLPNKEDLLINKSFYLNQIQTSSNKDSFICRDKNSFIQKVIENSEENFQKLRQDLLSLS